MGCFRPNSGSSALANPDTIVLDKSAIALENARLMRQDPTLYDLREIPARPARQQVLQWIQALSEVPNTPLYDVHGKQISVATLKALRANLDLGAIVPHPTTRYGLVVHRADLRTFPTTMRVFNERGDTDIDRFQESALFPGTPVLIVHTSRDRRWRFVDQPAICGMDRETSTLPKDRRARCSATSTRDPYRIVTGGTAMTVFTPERPSLSQLQLDMGTRVPLLGRLAGGPRRQRPASVHLKCHRTAVTQPHRRAGIQPRAAAEERRHASPTICP